MTIQDWTLNESLLVLAFSDPGNEIVFSLAYSLDFSTKLGEVTIDHGYGSNAAVIRHDIDESNLIAQCSNLPEDPTTRVHFDLIDLAAETTATHELSDQWATCLMAQSTTEGTVKFLVRLTTSEFLVIRIAVDGTYATFFASAVTNTAELNIDFDETSRYNYAQPAADHIYSMVSVSHIYDVEFSSPIAVVLSFGE